MAPPTLAESLGYPADARLVLFHADDVGMLHGGNRAYVELSRAGILKSGSVMIPCPWAPELLALCHDDPALDIGVHLTLTSEFLNYRWSPISTCDPATGLIDEHGYMWTTVRLVQERAKIEAAHGEMRRQIDRALAAGVDITHIDTHMGAASTPQLIDAYVALGFEYRVPVLLTREASAYHRPFFGPDFEARWANIVADVEARGMPLVDRFIISPGWYPGDKEWGRIELYERQIRAISRGVTFYSLHPNAPGDIEMVDPVFPNLRTCEYAYLQSDRLRALSAEVGIIPIGFREIRELMRRQAR